MKNKFKILLLVILATLCAVMGVACFSDNGDNGGNGGNGGETPSASFIIDHADVPDAYFGVAYDFNSLIVKQSGVTYSVESLYFKEGETKTDIEFSGMSFTPSVKNVYVYVIIKATANGKSVLSEEVRIRALSSIDYYLVNRADVPDAYVGSEYNLDGLLKAKQSGVSYSYEVYTLAEDGVTKNPVAVENGKFTPQNGNVYYYAVVTAKSATETNVSEAMRIRSLNFSIRSDVLVAAKYRPAATLNKVYRLDGLIHSQPGVSYTAEAYYKNGSAKEAIEVKDFKVTPTKVGENFFVVITAKCGEQTVVCDEIEITVDTPADVRDKNFMDNWNDSPLSEELNTDPQYVKVGNTSIKYGYKGYRNYYYNYGSVPFTDTEAFDVTDWSNAVLSFWIYNPNSYTFTMSQNLRHDAAGIYKDHTFSSVYERTVAANGWTQIVYSLRALGITTPFKVAGYGGNDYWGIKIHSDEIPYSAVAGDTEIDFYFYLDDVNVYNYSEELFPGLETRTPEQIKEDEYAAISGDELDRKIVAYTDKDSAVYQVTTDGATVKEGKSSIKATFTKSESFLHATENRAVFIQDQANVLFSAYGSDITDWSTAYLGFWLKNETGYGMNISLRFRTYNGSEWKGSGDLYFTSYEGNVGSKATDTEWEYKEFSLAEVAKAVEFEYHTEGVQGFYFGLATEIVSQFGVPVSFYIDGLKLYNKPAEDEFDVSLKGAAGELRNCTIEVNTDKDYVKEGDSSLKFSFTPGLTGYNPATRGGFNYHNVLADGDSVFGLTADSFKTDLYVSFWYKQTEKLYKSDGAEGSVSFRLALQNTQDGKDWQGLGYSFAYAGQRVMVNDTEWHFVEINLADVIKEAQEYAAAHNETAPKDWFAEDVKEYMLSLNFEIHDVAKATFYIDGVTISNTSKLTTSD